MERPLGIMLGETGTLVFDGLYQDEPLEWFLNDWIEQGAGGCEGVWKDKSKKKKSKKKKKKSEL